MQIILCRGQETNSKQQPKLNREVVVYFSIFSLFFKYLIFWKFFNFSIFNFLLSTFSIFQFFKFLKFKLFKIQHFCRITYVYGKSTKYWSWDCHHLITLWFTIMCKEINYSTNDLCFQWDKNFLAGVWFHDIFLTFAKITAICGMVNQNLSRPWELGIRQPGLMRNSKAASESLNSTKLERESWLSKHTIYLKGWIRFSMYIQKSILIQRGLKEKQIRSHNRKKTRSLIRHTSEYNL